MKDHFVWVEKYRPVSLDTFIATHEDKQRIESFFKQDDVIHLMFHGSPGIGKTTLAKIIASTLEADVLYINASDDNNVDTVRTKIKTFAASVSFQTNKIIILDEFDQMTFAAQAALRNIIESYSRTTRFIFTCNYIGKVIPAIQSRVVPILITPPSKADVAKHIVRILTDEGISYDMNSIKRIVLANYPDIRKTINTIQSNSVNGKLTYTHIGDEIGNEIIKILIQNPSQTKDITTMLTRINELLFVNDVDHTLMYTMLYDNVSKIVKSEADIPVAIIAIADGLRWDTTVANKNINLMATLTTLLQLKL